MKVLAFFAHPDDETILAGGTLALLAELGQSVHYLTATRGEGGEIGDPPRGVRAELGKIREEELQNAVAVLGGSSLSFLNYIDPIVGEDNNLFSFSDDMEQLVRELGDVINHYHIDVIITHGSDGEYGHPAHKFVHDVVQRFAIESLNPITWYTSQAYYATTPKPHLVNKSDPANWIVDVDTVIEKKTAAARAHKTQIPLFLRRKQAELQRDILLEEVIVDEESFRFAGGAEDILFDLLKSHGFIQQLF